MNLRYFCYHFKSTWLRMAIIVFICVIIAGTTAHSTLSQYEYWLDKKVNYPGSDYTLQLTLSLGIFAAMSIILNTILPAIELSIFNNRKYLDSGFSFPISRTAIVTTHLLTGFINFIVPFVASYISYTLMLLPILKYFDLKYIWEFFFLSILWSVLFYLFNAFFFSMCNSTADGVITSLSWQFILCPLLLVITDWLDLTNNGNLSLFGIVWYPYADICQYYTSMAVKRTDDPDLLQSINRYISKNISENMEIELNSYLTCYFLIVTALAVVLGIATVYFFNRRRAESAGEVSSSLVSYKVLIPLSVFLLLYIGSISSMLVFGLIALIFSTIAYIIYRRTIRLKVFDIIVIGLCFILFMIGFLQ